MTRKCDLELMVVHLDAVIRYAKSQGFDGHFISEAEHLRATVEANQEDG